MSYIIVKVPKNFINEDLIMMSILLLGGWLGVIVVSLVGAQIALKKFDLL